MNSRQPVALVIGLVAAAVVSSTVGCTSSLSQDHDPTEVAEGALLGAPLDTGDPWAVGVCASTPNANPNKGAAGACLEAGTRCTGSLVAPNLVLTARHCVKAIQSDAKASFCEGRFTKAPLSSTKPSVTLSPSVLQTNPVWIAVSEVLVPAGNNACDDDVALLVLAVPQQNVPMAGLDLDTNVATTPPSKLAVVGRGAIVDQIDPATGASVNLDKGRYLKRVLSDIPFLCASDTSGACTTPDATSTSGTFALSAGQLLMGPAGAPGDSGAGVLRASSYGTGAPSIVGVFSASTYDLLTGNSNGGLSVRVARHRAFFVSAAKWASSLGSYPLPAWAK